MDFQDEIKIIGDQLTYRGFVIAEIKKDLPTSLVGDFCDIIKNKIYYNDEELEEIEEEADDIECLIDDINTSVYKIRGKLEEIRGLK